MITQQARLRRQKKVRASLANNQGVPRLSVFRSNRYIWAQIIDDKHGKTLAASTSKTLKLTGTKTEIATGVGQDIATKALQLNVKKIRFDRGHYRYHGRVKALADGARKQGLIF